MRTIPLAPAATPAVADAADPMLPTPYRVRRSRRETRDAWTLELEPADGGASKAFAPGQFNMLYAWGVGEVAISISGDPTRPGRLVHTVRAVGPVTRALCGTRHGAAIGVRGPFGVGWPVQAAEGVDVLIAAGGVGLAPLRPALYHLFAHRQKYGRIALLYGARSPGDLLFAAELARWRGRFDIEVYVTVDHSEGDWGGPVGVVTHLLRYAHIDPAESVSMVCGPEAMMRFVGIELQRLGVPPDRIHVSLERSMKCGVGLCGHCQLGPELICRDGPVFPLARVQSLLRVREL